MLSTSTRDSCMYVTPFVLCCTFAIGRGFAISALVELDLPKTKSRDAENEKRSAGSLPGSASYVRYRYQEAWLHLWYMVSGATPSTQAIVSVCFRNESTGVHFEIGF